MAAGTVDGMDEMKLNMLRRELQESWGTFSDGYDDGDVDATLPPLSEATGLLFAVVWDYVDMLGPGGDSEIVVKRDGRWFTASDALVRHLHGDSPADELLSQLVVGADIHAALVGEPVPNPEGIEAGTGAGVANVGLAAYEVQAPKWA